jgi:hypothetical protein
MKRNWFNWGRIRRQKETFMKKLKGLLEFDKG